MSIERMPTEEELATALWMYGLRAQVFETTETDGIHDGTVALVAGQMEAEAFSDCGFGSLQMALTAALDHPQVRKRIFEITRPSAIKIRSETYE